MNPAGTYEFGSHGGLTNGQGAAHGRALGDHRTALAAAEGTPARRATSRSRPPSAHGHSLRTQDRHSLGRSSARDGLRLGDDLLATSSRLAPGWRMEQGASRVAGQTTKRRPDRLVVGRCRQCFGSSAFWGAKTGPNPTDRRKNGSKHHTITDANGIPLGVLLTGANRHDVTQLLPLIDAIPEVSGKVGPPRYRPDTVQGDRGYDSEPHRRALRELGIEPLLAKRNTAHGSGLGETRWVVERTLSWLHQFRRLRIRYEYRADIHEAFMAIGCCIICWRFLEKTFC